MQRQGSFAETEYAGKKKQTRRDKFLAEMEQVVPWARIFAILQNGGKDDRVKALSSEMRREVMRVSHDIDARPRHDIEIDAIVADPNVLRADIEHVPEHHPVPRGRRLDRVLLKKYLRRRRDTAKECAHPERPFDSELG